MAAHGTESSQAAYVIGAARTPIGKLLGSLADLTAPELGAAAIRAALRRAAVSAEEVEEVVMGNVLTAGVGQAPARQAALRAGCRDDVSALTINKVCGSGLRAVMLADQAIRCGDARLLVAGGMESMSNAPYLLPDARRPPKLGDRKLVDSLLHDGLWCAHHQVIMGDLAERLAHQQAIGREAQDAFAAESHRRAATATEQRRWVEIEAVCDRRGERIERDQGPRADCSLADLERLPGVFSVPGSAPATPGRKAGPGTVTAGNASQISDGAAAVVVASGAVARHAPWRARIVATATSGGPPEDLFTAPVNAVRKVLQKAGMTAGEIDLFEINEAFAVQCLACASALEIPAEKLNVHGGAIALGHPIGASGARVLVTLLYALQERRARWGIASLCLGGGNAVAMLLELEQD